MHKFAGVIICTNYHVTMICSYIPSFRNPNEPRPMKNKWPVYNEDKQYLRILRDQTVDPVRSNLLPSEENLWNKIVPALLSALEQSSQTSRQAEHGYCERDGGCKP